MRIGRFPVAREAKLVAAVREVVGPDVLLMADGNAAYTMESAVRMGHVLNELNFECFEEPLPQSPKYTAYEFHRERLPLSLATAKRSMVVLQRKSLSIVGPWTLFNRISACAVALPKHCLFLRDGGTVGHSLHSALLGCGYPDRCDGPAALNSA